MFESPLALQECIEEILGPPGSPNSLIGTFANGAPAIWINYKQAPKRGERGLHIYIEPIPAAGSIAHHNWVVTIYSIGETSNAGQDLWKAFAAVREHLPRAMHTHQPYSEQGWQKLTLSIPNDLSNGPFDYA